MVSNGLAIIVAHTRGRERAPLFGADLAGLPLLAHALREAKETPGISHVSFVCDDATLLPLALRSGADSALCGPEKPSATFESLLCSALTAADAQGEKAEILLCIDAAFPLMRASDYHGLLQGLTEPSVDCVSAALAVSGPAWPLAVDAGSAELTQDAEKAASFVIESHAAYAIHAHILRSHGRLKAGRTRLKTCARERGLSVTTSLEQQLAEVVLRHDLQANQRALLPRPLKAVVFDFDGVMTDNGVWVTQDAQESVRCDRGDGMGLGLLKATGTKLLILSKERNPVVSARAKKLGIECLQGIDNKLDELQRWLARYDVAASEAIYIGNDVNDLECMRHVGCAVCPRDAHDSARIASRIVLTRDGGRGAVRELCDLILESLASD